MKTFKLKDKQILPILLLLLLSLTSLIFLLNRKTVVAKDTTTKEQQAFITTIAEEAQQLQDQTHLFASITIAQAILESNWGQSELAIEANNLFGIKGSYDDQSSILPTTEVIDGETIIIDDEFKKYATVQESMIDHIHFLSGGTYEAISTSKNYKETAYALQDGGYATDPDYAEKLIALIEEFQLNKYDL